MSAKFSLVSQNELQNMQQDGRLHESIHEVMDAIQTQKLKIQRLRDNGVPNQIIQSNLNKLHQLKDMMENIVENSKRDDIKEEMERGDKEIEGIIAKFLKF